MHDHRQVANPIHFNAIGGTFQNELRGSLAFQAVDQTDDRDVLLHLTKSFQCLRFLPIRAGILGDHKVKGLRMEEFGKLLGSYHNICADYESCLLEFIQTVLNLRQETMNKEDSHGISSEPKCLEWRGPFRLVQVGFGLQRHKKRFNIAGWQVPSAKLPPGSIEVTSWVDYELRSAMAVQYWT